MSEDKLIQKSSDALASPVPPVIPSVPYQFQMPEQPPQPEFEPSVQQQQMYGSMPWIQQQQQQPEQYQQEQQPMMLMNQMKAMTVSDPSLLQYAPMPDMSQQPYIQPSMTSGSQPLQQSHTQSGPQPQLGSQPQLTPDASVMLQQQEQQQQQPDITEPSVEPAEVIPEPRALASVGIAESGVALNQSMSISGPPPPAPPPLPSQSQLSLSVRQSHANLKSEATGDAATKVAPPSANNMAKQMVTMNALQGVVLKKAPEKEPAAPDARMDMLKSIRKQDVSLICMFHDYQLTLS